MRVGTGSSAETRPAMPLLAAIALDDRDGTGLEVVWSKQLFERDPTEGSEAPKPDTFPSSRQSTELHNSRAPALNLMVFCCGFVLYELVSPGQSISLPVERQKGLWNKVSYSEAKFSAMFTLKYTELKCSRVESGRERLLLRFQDGGSRKDCRAPAGDGSHAKEQGDRGAVIRFPRLRTRLAGKRHKRKSRDWAWRSRRAV